jgi:hypothetical protein
MLPNRAAIRTFLISGLFGLFLPVNFQCFSNNQDSVQNLPTTIPLKGTLPESLNEQQDVWLIGVSDPGIADTLVARNQALARAMFLYSLQYGSGGVVSEFYSRNNEKHSNDKFEDLYLLNCKAKLQEKSYLSKFYKLETGEYVAKLILSEQTGNHNPAYDINSMLEIYNKELTDAGQGNTFGKLILNIAVQSDQQKSIAKYILRFSGLNRQWVESDWDSLHVNINSFRCFYGNFSVSDNETDFSDGSTTLYGLWYAFLKEISVKLSEELQNQYQRTKSIGEQYQNTLSTMQRNSGKFSFEWKISDFCVVDNTLKIKWNKVNQ